MAKAVRAAASARLLLDSGDADGACNRAYYAMFDAARAALLASGFDVGKTHRGLVAAFSDRFIRTGRLPKEMGRSLKHAETFRYVADYEGERVEPGEAAQLVDQAAVFVKTMLNELVRTDAQGEP